MLTKSFFLDLHGCAKNQVDAEIICGILQNLGWQYVEDAHLAELIVINSCGFIEDAKKESIASIIDLKKACPNAKILLAGCLAERYSDIFVEDMEEVDAVFGNGDLSKLPVLINALFPKYSSAQKNKSTLTEKKEGAFKKPLLKPEQKGISCGERPNLFNFASVAYIKITEGCNNFCSFCAIPLIRGRLRSRSIQDITQEIRQFIEKGIYEFNLVGQDLGVFGMEDDLIPSPSPLSLLLKEIKKLEGRFVVRLLYIHPDHFPLDILPVMKSDERFLPYFDIPFQSGDDSIIQKMNRKGSFKRYLQLIENIRSSFKGSKFSYVAIRTTFLVGFPTEKDEEFINTLNFLKELRPLFSGVFTYSKEEDTPSFSMRGQVLEKLKKKRQKILEDEQKKITSESLKAFLGKTFLVLVEELIENEGEHLAIGRSWFQAPDVDGVVVFSYKEGDRSIDDKKIEEGALIWVEMNKVSDFDLIGKATGVEK